MSLRDALVDAWTWNLWYGTACVVAGVLVLALPLLLSRRARRWFSRTNVDIAHIGLLALIAVLLCIAIPNYLRTA